MNIRNFQKNILSWYGKEKRDLPWRRTSDPYCIWISEIMLQQTTVKAVIPYYEKWLKKFPDISSLAKAPLEKVLKAWEGLGYYSRARNLHKAAKAFHENYNDNVPDDHKTLLKIPGFGPYTAGAVMSIAFGRSYPLVDANVKRFYTRVLCLKGEKKNVHQKKIEFFAEEAVPLKKAGDFNQGLMEIGALICKKNSPLCLACPVKTFCIAYEKGLQEVVMTTQKKDYEVITAAVGIIKKKNTYLIQKRPEKGLLAGLWEFPGGKKKKGETLPDCLKREIKEELKCDCDVGAFLLKVRHFYTRFKVDLHAYHVELKGNIKKNKNLKWVTLKDMQAYPFPSGSARIVDYLKKQTTEVRKQKTEKA